MHVPVLMDAVLDRLRIVPGGTYVDCTLGGGGHAEALLKQLGPEGRLLALDCDPAAVESGRERLGAWKEQCIVQHANFGALEQAAREAGIKEADGVLFDFGISSDQLDQPGRGFSFQEDGPLDMRTNTTQGESAAEFIARVDEETLTQMLRSYGDEHAARRVSRAIIRERQEKPIRTTAHLAEVVARAKGGRRGKIHPATKAFMALRMAVNQELDNLHDGLEQALHLLRPGGRLAAITFHSVEDRAVKQQLGRHVGTWVSLQEGGERWEGEEPVVKWVGRKPVKPTKEEIEKNPRARSAKLRTVEKVS